MRRHWVERAPEHQRADGDQRRRERERFGGAPPGDAPPIREAAQIDREQDQQGESRHRVRQPPLLPDVPERAGGAARGHQPRAPQRGHHRPEEHGEDQVRDHLPQRLQPAGAAAEAADPERRDQRAGVVHDLRPDHEADAGSAQSVGQVVTHARRQQDDPPVARVRAQEHRGHDGVGREENRRADDGETQPGAGARADIAARHDQRRDGGDAPGRCFARLVVHGHPYPPDRNPTRVAEMQSSAARDASCAGVAPWLMEGRRIPRRTSTRSGISITRAPSSCSRTGCAGTSSRSVGSTWTSAGRGHRRSATALR